MTSPMRGIAAVALAAALTSAPASASIYGPLDNFDVVNDTGGETCGFEIELEGVHSADVYRTFAAPEIRYASPTLTDTATGVRIRYQATWNPVTHTFSPVTPPAAPGYIPASDSCWVGGLGSGYDAAGCEHFGVSQTTQPTASRYHWLACNPANGTVTSLPDIGLPTPVWTVIPPAVPADPPVVRAAFEIPNPNGGAYGEAYWVKIYKTEADHAIELNELLLDDPLVEGAVTEIEWELLQAKPGQAAVFNEAPLAPGAEAVVRRYEFHHYDTAWGLANGYVDPENGEVMECVVNGCNDPTPEEMGGYVGRQMAGFNVDPNALAAGPACSNGLDDDGDGLADLTDPGCAYASSTTESPQCDDGIDNDADGSFDLDDPGCAGFASNGSENPPSCGLFGIEGVAVLASLALRRRRNAPRV